MTLFPSLPHNRLRPARIGLLSLAVVAALLAAVATGGAAAASAPVGGARALSVSVPPDPIPFKPGVAQTVEIRVTNPNPRRMTATISPRGLSFGDNGKTSMLASPDPRWSSLDFPKAPIAIPAEGFRDVPLRIRLPRQIEPDLYFIGFLVTPQQQSAGNLQVVNQIGSFLTVDVPGPRVRSLHATFDLSSFVVGTHVHGTLRIANTGHTVVRYWGENDTTASGGSFSEQRLDPSLLPVGSSSIVSVSRKAGWPVGRVTMTVHLIYPGRTESSTDELTFTKTVLVVSPLVPGGAVALLTLIAGTVLLRLRRRGRLVPALA